MTEKTTEATNNNMENEIDSGRFQQMSIVEREESMDTALEKLLDIKKNNSELNFSVIVDMVHIVANTYYSQNASIIDDSESPNIRNNIHGIIGKARWIITLVIDIFKNNDGNYNLYNNIEKIETNSETMNHITKVFLSYIAFSLYYNDFIDKGFFSKKIRTTFKDKYMRYYKKKQENSTVTVESIFKGGIRRLDEINKLPDYATGALLYDIGKIIDHDYHDNPENEYDEHRTKKHVLAGYNMLINTKNFPRIVSLMSAFHHEYYGGKDSYNFSMPLLSKLNNKKHETRNIHYLVSFDEEEFIKGDALSYFPIKMLEIVDVYDAIKNKKKKSISDTLMIMKKEFIAQSLKIDPILFGIFLHFKKDCGAITEVDVDKILDHLY